MLNDPDKGCPPPVGASVDTTQLASVGAPASEPPRMNSVAAGYERLKASAQSHRRSLYSEAIVCLESVLLPTKMPPTERLARARELRDALPKGKFSARDIDAAKRADRP